VSYDYKIPPPSLFDRVIEIVSPKRGLQRRQARAQLAFAEWSRKRGEIIGANSHRGRTDWTNTTQSADSLVRNSREKVRNIVRQLIVGNPYARGAVDRLVGNVVGRGIRPQSAVEADTPESTPLEKPAGWTVIEQKAAERFRREAEQYFAEFAAECDVAGKLNFFEMQEVLCRSVIHDGEVLVNLPKKKNRWGFGIELIEADRLGTPIKKLTDAAIRDGVELDPETGEPKAYWVSKQHPGDSLAIALGSYKRIPRWLDMPGGVRLPRCLHPFRVTRPGQTRGFSDFAPTLHIFEDLHRYWEAEIMAARIAACYGVFVTSPVSATLAANAGSTNADGDRVETLEPGRMQYLNPGETVTFGNPQRPNSAFEAFTQALLRAIGVAVGLPFELIALDFSKTNYSSARASLLEARRGFQARQAFLIHQFCRPIWEMVILTGVLRGDLDARGFMARRRDYLRSVWTPPSWGWVDPVKEYQAAKGSIRSYLSTHAEELAARGLDFEEVAGQASREHKKLKEMGLPSPWDVVAVGEKPTADLDKESEKKELVDAIAND